MASGVLNRETCSHRKLSGTVLVRNIQITGWCVPGAKLNEFSQNGRLWGVVSGTTVSLYRSINPDGTYTASEKVLEGTGAEDDLITLSEQNSSGLSGFLRYTGSGDFDVIFAYASEQELLDMIPGNHQQVVWQIVERELTNNPLRLQGLLDSAKREVDRTLIRDLEDGGKGIYVDDAGETVAKPFPIDGLNRYEMATLSQPEALRDAQIWLLLKNLTKRLVGSNEYAKEAMKSYSKLFMDEWQNLRLWIDSTANMENDGNRRVSPVAYRPRRL